MKYADFHTYVSCINRTSANWLHEGVTMKLNRAKGEESINDDAVRRFLRDVRSDLDEIESRLTQQEQK